MNSKYEKLAEAFQHPDPSYDLLAEAWKSEEAKSPAQRRAETERWLSFAAQVEASGSKYAKAAGWLRRSLAADLFASKVVDGTPFGG